MGRLGSALFATVLLVGGGACSQESAEPRASNTNASGNSQSGSQLGGQPIPRTDAAEVPTLLAKLKDGDAAARKDAAERLGFSVTYIYRHAHELPFMRRHGRS